MKRILPLRGDLIRWIRDWAAYSVDEDGEAVGETPVYDHGIVLGYADSVKLLVVYSHTQQQKEMIDLNFVDIEIIGHK